MDNCGMVGYVYPVQNFIGYVNQDPLMIIVGFTNC